MASKPQPLDVRTLRAISRRLRARVVHLDKMAQLRTKETGIKRSWTSVGRANECDLQADNMLTEAKAIESKARGERPKAARKR